MSFYALAGITLGALFLFHLIKCCLLSAYSPSQGTARCPAMPAGHPPASQLCPLRSCSDALPGTNTAIPASRIKRKTKG